MARFFRKIRQQLLKENENKFLRYISYVIGEIVIVVIGIITDPTCMNVVIGYVDEGTYALPMILPFRGSQPPKYRAKHAITMSRSFFILCLRVHVLRFFKYLL